MLRRSTLRQAARRQSEPALRVSFGSPHVQRKLQILGFNRPSATSHPNTVGEVKTAFRDQCKILHPDCGGNEQAFREVNEAYMALMAEHSLNIESSTRRKPHYQPPPSAGSAARYSSTYGTRSSQGSYYNFNSSGQRSADGSFRSHYGGMSDRQREMWRRRQAEYEEQQQQHQYQGQGNQQQTYASHEDSQAEADYQAYSQRHPEGSPENYTLNFLTYVACFGTGFLCYYWSYNAGDHRAAVASALQPAAPAGYFPPREFPRPEPHIPVEEGAPRYLHPKDAKQIQVYLASQDYRGQSWPDTQPDVNPLPGVQTTVSEHKEPHTYKLQDQWEVKAHMAHQIFDPKGHADMIKAAQREKREERERLTKEKLPKLMEERRKKKLEREHRTGVAAQLQASHVQQSPQPASMAPDQGTPLATAAAAQTALTGVPAPAALDN